MGIGMLRRHREKPTKDKKEKKAKPVPPPATNPGVPAPPPVEFTGSARNALMDSGFGVDQYDGPASGASGNVVKSDVEDWLLNR